MQFCPVVHGTESDTNGFLKSPSVNPAARKKDRAGARATWFFAPGCPTGEREKVEIYKNFKSRKLLWIHC